MINSSWTEIDLSSLGNAPAGVRICAGFILVVSIFMMAYWVDYSFVWENYCALKEKFFTLENKYQQYQRLISKLPEIRQDALEISSKLTLMKEKLPEAFEEAEWLEEIATRASSALVSIAGIKPLREERQEAFLSKTFELKLQGKFSALYTFIRGLSFESRLSSVQDFSLALEKNNPDSIDLKLILKIYALPAVEASNLTEGSLETKSSFSLEDATAVLENNAQVDIASAMAQPLEINALIRNPFDMQLVENETSNRTALCSMQSHYQREPLEWFSLDALRFIGIIKQGTQMWGLIRDNYGVIHRVNVGTKMGTHCGSIEKIDDNDLVVKERILENDEWKTRETRLRLS